MRLTLANTSWKFSDQREWVDHFGKWPPVIVTCAITGAMQGKEANPNLPENPQEQADSAYGAYKAGAAQIHIHARDPKTNYVKPAMGPEDFLISNIAVRERCPDVIINDTCATLFFQKVTYQYMLDYYKMIKAETSTLDVGAMFMRRRQKARAPGEKDTVVETSNALGFELVENIARAARTYGAKSEFELFSGQSWWFVDNVINKGIMDPPPYWTQLVFGQEGACSPPTPMAAMQIIGNLPVKSLFSTIGIGPLQIPINIVGLILGGHIRVGMEDNVYYRRGELAKSNQQFVERAVRLVHELHREVATPAQAREMLGLSQTPQKYP